MLPLVLASQIRSGIEDFLRTSFSMPSGLFENLVEDFIKRGSAFKGPYLSLGLPFRKASCDSQNRPLRAWFPEVLPPGFVPFLHQELAFERLAPRDSGVPRSTIVATGTGSGKTECFLMPILEHCRREMQRGKRGVKAVLLYPMNALATDQAGRLARAVADDGALRGVRAGLYIGGQEPGSGSTKMTESGVVTNRECLRDNPPDILITNYKMLDYLLVRPDDVALWRFNEPETLSYLVVDELHTFDGAQGTDLACLIRRLKARLGMPEGALCCVGTSATLGNDDGSMEQLLKYAGDIFGEEFTRESVITEHRLSPAEFLGDSVLKNIELPSGRDRERLSLSAYATPRDYLAAQYGLWFLTPPPADIATEEARRRIGVELKSCLWFQNLVRLLKTEIALTDELAERLFPRVEDAELRTLLLDSLLSLVSTALETAPDGRPGKSLLHLVRTQLWIRELSRIVVSVSRTPELAFHSDITTRTKTAFLPLVSCRECGAGGWLSVTDVQDNTFSTDLDAIYRAFFSRSKNSARAYSIFFPDRTRAETLGETGTECVVCGGCNTLRRRADADGRCPVCHSEHCIPVYRHTSLDGMECPFCKARHSWLILGSRAASLTSAVISILYGSRANDDKKLITFSDNVQDAAHRAGFFGARTFNTTLRTAIQQCLQQCGENGDPLLKDFPGIFRDYWRSRLSPEAYLARFIHPSMEWFASYEALCRDGKLPKDSRLPADVGERLGWEIANAYTLNASVGRTLEKSGASIACVPVEQLRAAAHDLRTLLTGQDDRLRDCTETQCQAFVAGFLTHLRRNGAVFAHPLMENFIRNRGNIYSIGQKTFSYMPRFGPKHKSPRFLSESVRENFESVTSASGNTWCLKWGLTIFPELAGLGNVALQNVYAAALGVLGRAGILDHREPDGKRVWGIASDALRLTTRVGMMRCGRCRQLLSVAAAEAPLWEGAPCLRLCGGTYAAEPEKTHFYGNLYRNGAVERLHTAEHTGLLQRQEREELELSFKRKRDQRKPWDCNLLSCTPTLEMGIDIGELSTTIQCSVPPAQANYLQRIGRAGRCDGNALNITIAGSKTHDLYFYANPRLMMRGTVTPPGVFLNASAVLERQLTAYCMDCWVRSGLPAGAVPDILGKALAAVERRRKARTDDEKHNADKAFPYNFLTYIDLHATELLERFLSLFGEAMSAETKEYLRRFLFGETDQNGERQTPLGIKIITGLGRTLRERDGLRKRIQKARAKSKALAAAPAQDESTEKAVRHLRMEADALTALVAGLQNRKTLQFFTDEGLMPNYAFPEQGVTLHSIIYRKREKSQGKGNYDITTYEYGRAAQSALTEFAPGNAFYAGKRKVLVNQVDMESGKTELWRLCPACSYAEPNRAAAVQSACPRCGSTLFADSGQLREMLRMTQVYATTSDKDSRLGDDAESREPQFFVRQLLIDYEPEALEQAFKLDTEETVFGYAYIRKADFREINFGEADDSPGVAVAGVVRPRRGFRICRQCGSVLGNSPDPTKHTWGCPAHAPGAKEQVLDCVYLYRDFSSEAVKMLLPFTNDAFTQSRTDSFIAAFSLGLKLRFGGALAHLQSTLHSEPDPADAGLRKQYLVIYDTVPGGTGYLKQIIRGNALFEVFTSALRHMERCTCEENPRGDGCYQCLLAYRNSRLAASISKKEAVDTLRELLRYQDKLVAAPTLDGLTAGSLYESELEKRFIEALRRSNSQDRKIRLERQLVNGQEGFFLEIGDARWTIEQQVPLGEPLNVSVPSRADFVFRPARSAMNTKPLVVFTDGYSYHQDRLGKDAAQRTALLLSGNFRVWSLCWEDVNSAFNGKEEPYCDLVEDGWGDAAEKVWAKWGLHGVDRIPPARNSFSLLLDFLARPDPDGWRRVASTYATIAALGRIGAPLRDEVASLSPRFLQTFALQENAAMAKCASFVSCRRFASIGREPENAPPASVLLLLDDGEEARGSDQFRAIWRGYLRAMNVFQFADSACAATRSGCDAGLFDSLDSIVPGRSLQARLVADQRVWQDALELITDDRAQALLERLMRENAPVPEIGFELTGDGRVLGEAELAWPDRRIGVLTEDNDNLLHMADSLGWRLFSLAATSVAQDLIDTLGSQT